MRLLLGYLSDLRCEEVGAGATALQSEESPALSSFKGKKKTVTAAVTMLCSSFTEKNERYK